MLMMVAVVVLVGEHVPQAISLFPAPCAPTWPLHVQGASIEINLLLPAHANQPAPPVNSAALVVVPERVIVAVPAAVVVVVGSRVVIGELVALVVKVSVEVVVLVQFAGGGDPGAFRLDEVHGLSFLRQALVLANGYRPPNSRCRALSFRKTRGSPRLGLGRAARSPTAAPSHRA